MTADSAHKQHRPYIHRVDHPGSHTHCWRVTIQRQTHIYREAFSDGQYGGCQQALEAAEAYRDAILHKHPPFSKPDYCAIVKKNNRSGISGLTRVDRWELRRGRRVRRLCWEVQWPIGNGRARHRKFSILKYGEEGALQKALAARETAMQALASQTFSPYEAAQSRHGQVACMELAERHAVMRGEQERM